MCYGLYEEPRDTGVVMAWDVRIDAPLKFRLSQLVVLERETNESPHIP